MSWHKKKQAWVELSIAKAKYIVIESCCAQILWLKQQLKDYSLKLSKVPLMCDKKKCYQLDQKSCSTF